jgi:hypothetical protein
MRGFVSVGAVTLLSCRRIILNQRVQNIISPQAYTIHSIHYPGLILFSTR